MVFMIILSWNKERVDFFIRVRLSLPMMCRMTTTVVFIVMLIAAAVIAAIFAAVAATVGFFAIAAVNH